MLRCSLSRSTGASRLATVSRAPASAAPAPAFKAERAGSSRSGMSAQKRHWWKRVSLVVACLGCKLAGSLIVSFNSWKVCEAMATARLMFSVRLTIASTPSMRSESLLRDWFSLQKASSSGTVPMKCGEAWPDRVALSICTEAQAASSSPLPVHAKPQNERIAVPFKPTRMTSSTTSPQHFSVRSEGSNVIGQWQLETRDWHLLQQLQHLWQQLPQEQRPPQRQDFGRARHQQKAQRPTAVTAAQTDKQRPRMKPGETISVWSSSGDPASFAICSTAPSPAAPAPNLSPQNDDERPEAGPTAPLSTQRTEVASSAAETGRLSSSVT
mmetsp:Transcript_11492/g.36079  ORF Transcript_11492/g.36079 Transcript_11492/m.36079 type:complete len:326 (-) Transcript_11492:142-1119(-)